MTVKALILLALAVTVHALWAVACWRRPCRGLLRTKRHFLRLALHAGCPSKALHWMPL